MFPIQYNIFVQVLSLNISSKRGGVGLWPSCPLCGLHTSWQRTAGSQLQDHKGLEGFRSHNVELCSCSSHLDGSQVQTIDSEGRWFKLCHSYLSHELFQAQPHLQMQVAPPTSLPYSDDIMTVRGLTDVGEDGGMTPSSSMLPSSFS